MNGGLLRGEGRRTRRSSVYRTRRLARAASTTAQSAITTVTDITGATISFTLSAAQVARGVQIAVDAEYGWITASTSSLQGKVSMTDESNNVKKSKLFGLAATGAYSAPPRLREVITVAGAYTRKLRIERVVGTGTINHNVDLADADAWIEANEILV